MTNIPNDPYVAKAFGAVLGAIAGLLYSKPKNLRDTLSRFVFSLIAGFTLYFVPVRFFGWEWSNDHITAGAVVMAFVSWYVAGPVIKWALSKTKAE